MLFFLLVYIRTLGTYYFRSIFVRRTRACQYTIRQDNNLIVDIFTAIISVLIPAEHHS